eukprot:SAG31_NODE_2292_length_5998_cov_10.622817_4_plen_58_part_00
MSGFESDRSDEFDGFAEDAQVNHVDELHCAAHHQLPITPNYSQLLLDILVTEPPSAN